MRVPQLTIDMLVAVIALARKKTLDKAAEEIGVITASAVYKRVQAASKLFGAPLFLNTEHGMVLTEAGQALYVDAVKAVEQTLLAEERVASHLDLTAARLLVGHSTYLAPRLLASVLKLSFDEPTSIQIEHLSGFTEDIARQVVEGKLHAGFGHLPIHLSELATRVLWEEPLAVCMSSSHRLAVHPSIRPIELMDQPLVAIGRATLPWLHQEIEEYLAGFGISPQVVADAFGPPEAVIMAEQRIGICLLAPSAVSRPGAVTRPLEPRILMRKSGLFIREDNRHPAVKALVEKALETIPGKLRKV
jgi:LysR family cyn operon transcriptional activator